MKRYDSEAICKHCGKTYGEHAWENDTCPEEKSKYISVHSDLDMIFFSETQSFEPKGEGE